MEVLLLMHKLNGNCTTRVNAAGRHSLPEELLELLLVEPESRPRLQATNTVLKPLFITRRCQLMGKSLVISNSLIGASLSEPHTIVVYGTTCIDRPTDRPIDRPTDRPTDRVRPIHVMMIRCTCPRCQAAMPHSCPTCEQCSA